ncbi:hypothetical protein BDV26DRAFT_139646 [Aspergillus bertholletiae]|uniref:Transcription factor domain-containing protein n=1 Tax=Aspergillus bertholletiae TaxID=1226010 RepID=A0A5N7BNP5_9EURO|nr:hypothetical protein BDV26DRAFT_139646 [Aspergillus bertholletiae]
MNCLDAQVNCTRNRPRRRKRPRTSQATYITERLLTVELPPSTPPQPIHLSTIRDAQGAGLSHKQYNAGNDANPTPYVPQSIEKGQSEPITTSTRDALTQQTSEATKFLQRELEFNTTLTRDRYAALKEATNFVRRISKNAVISSTNEIPKVPQVQEDTRSQPFQPELLCMMSMDNEPSVLKRSYWPDHISQRTLENMCLSLMEGRGDEQTLTRYRICVYMKATTLVSRLPKKDRSPRLQDHLKRTKKLYENEILRALGKLDYLASPSLSFLQALLSGTIFMQVQGDMSRSWTLAAFASKTLVSLNYHMIEKPSFSNATDQDIHGALYTCYYLDKILSVLLLRPPSLPKLKVNPTDLVRLNAQLPLTGIVKYMVELGQFQERVLDILFDDKSDQVTAINLLVHDMSKLYLQMNECRTQPTFKAVEYEWIAIEFGYHAILTSVFHMNQRAVKGPLTRGECLKSARNALRCLTKLQEVAVMDANFIDEYPLFLTWTMLFFPLNPFFILFCNVVCTGDMGDYGLMDTVTKELSRFMDTNSSVAELHRLFSKFLNLCHPLVQNDHQASFQPTPNRSAITSTPDIRARPPSPLRQDLPGSNATQIRDNLFHNQHDTHQPEQLDSDNDLMWELVYSQPWLGWMNSDVLTGSSNMDEPLPY